MIEQIRARGRIDPPNMQARHDARHARHMLIRASFAADQPLPATYDCTNLCTPIKDQGNCGCHDSATEVLTEKGWVGWPEYDWSTPLGTMNPETGRLEFQAPTQRHVYDYDGPLYFGGDHRSLDFALTPNHRMIVSRNGDPWRFREVSDLPKYVDIPHATTGWLGTELERLGIGDRVYCGDDLLALIANVISCGHVGHLDDGNGGQNNITFSCFRDDRVESVRTLAHRLGIHEQASRPGVWYFRDATLAEWFRQNAYDGEGFTAGHKRVPMLVKCASQRQIEHFLREFGDQHTQTYGGRRFYSGSRLMIDDLQELLLRTGKRGTIEESPPRRGYIKSTGQVVHGKLPELILTERQRDGLSIDKENTRVEQYKGQVFCATVPNGRLVTRRNGSVLISGNSCWDFSGVCLVESANIKAGVLPDNSAASQLSEQYILDGCDGSNGGCSGDDNTTVLADAKSVGIPLTSAYGPYEATEQKCKLPRQRVRGETAAQLYTAGDWGYVSGQSGVADTNAIKAAMIAYGPIGCGIAADNAFEAWGDNGPNDATFTGSGSRSIDHDVVLVGWDDTKGAWKLRNSWGTGWCNAGYIWIAYGANQVGYEAVWASAPGPGPAPVPDPPDPIPVPPTPTPSPISVGPVELDAAGYSVILRDGLLNRVHAGSVTIPAAGNYTINFQQE